MRRNTLNYVTDAVTLLVFLAMAATGLLMEYILPPGRGMGGGRAAVWGWDRHAFGDLHFYLSLTLIGLLVVHVILHWGWVCQTTRSMLRGRATGPGSLLARSGWGGLFVGAMVCSVGGFLWIANANVTGFEGNNGGGHGRGRNGGARAELVADHARGEKSSSLACAETCPSGRDGSCSKVTNAAPAASCGDEKTASDCASASTCSEGKTSGCPSAKPVEPAAKLAAACPSASTCSEGKSGGCPSARPAENVAHASEKSVAHGGEHESCGDGDVSGIRGNITLADAARLAGVDAATLAAHLKLPADVDPAERLGQLKRQYGFEMGDVRLAVSKLRTDSAAGR